MYIILCIVYSILHDVRVVLFILFLYARHRLCDCKEKYVIVIINLIHNENEEMKLREYPDSYTNE